MHGWALMMVSNFYKVFETVWHKRGLRFYQAQEETIQVCKT